MKNALIIPLALFLVYTTTAQVPGKLGNTRLDGYRGIWFTLGQFTEHGDKYSGGLATCFVKHRPVAIYVPEEEKTFFVYGGTTSAEDRRLLCMISYYDHRRGMVPIPLVVCEKVNVDDPHDNPSLLIDKKGYIWVFVAGRARNVYLKDIAFDNQGNPCCLYLTSRGHQPGPDNAPYRWHLTRWTGSEWITSKVCKSDHNYDMGSLFITDSAWFVAAPVINGPQRYATGGEIAVMVSRDRKKRWWKQMRLTRHSKYNHSYIRRPLNPREPFHFFWADGDPGQFSQSCLYFGSLTGEVWRLPYEMQDAFERPERLNFSSILSRSPKR